jgi:curved DNA-binding protein CbpA
MNLYEILGVKKDAPLDEIERAYKRLAHKHHPDKGGDREEWEQLAFAYTVLGNPEKRQIYDNFGRTEMPKIEVEVQNVLLQGFSQALQTRQTNVIKFMRDFINAGRLQVAAQKEQAIKEIQELRTRRDTVETTSEENLFHLIVDQAIQARENLVQDAEIKLSVATVCHEVLNTYKSKEPILPVVRRPPRDIFQHIFTVDASDIERMKREFQENVKNMDLSDLDFGFDKDKD